MRWTGGRLEIGRVWLTWRGWKRPTSFRIGSTRVFTVGPVAVFVQSATERGCADMQPSDPS